MKYFLLIISVLLLSSANAEEYKKAWFENKYRWTSTWIETDPNSRLDSFRKSAKWWSKNKEDKNIKILSCSKLVAVKVATARGNTSYGGICSVKNKSETNTAFVCNDEMVGHFSIQSKNKGPLSVNDLIQFVYDHCYGG